MAPTNLSSAVTNLWEFVTAEPYMCLRVVLFGVFGFEIFGCLCLYLYPNQ